MAKANYLFVRKDDHISIQTLGGQTVGSLICTDEGLAVYLQRVLNSHSKLLDAARLGLTTIQATKDELNIEGVYEENIAIIEKAIASAEGR